jgi:hypothetical protein
MEEGAAIDAFQKSYHSHSSSFVRFCSIINQFRQVTTLFKPSSWNLSFLQFGIRYPSDTLQRHKVRDWQQFHCFTYSHRAMWQMKMEMGNGCALKSVQE